MRCVACRTTLLPKRSPLDFVSSLKQLCPVCFEMEILEVNEQMQAICDHLWSPWVGCAGQWLRSCERCYHCHVSHTEEPPLEGPDLDVDWAAEAYEAPSKEHEE